MERQEMFISKLETAMKKYHAIGYVIIGELGHNHEIKLEEDVDLMTETDYGAILDDEEVTNFHCVFLTRDRNLLLKSVLDELKNLKVNTKYEAELGFVDPIVADLSTKLAWANVSRQTMASKFNNLFTLTYAITKYNHWMIDEDFESSDGELNHFIRQLGSAWSNALYYSDKALGIESEYTRPGVELLLDGLKAKLAHLPYPNVRAFEWDTYKQNNINRAIAKKRKAESEANSF